MGSRSNQLDNANTATDLLRLGLAGRLSRRELIERAARLGLGVGVVGSLLIATGLETAANVNTPVSDGKKTKPGGVEIKNAQIVAGVVGSIDTLNPWTTNLYAQGMDVLSGVMDGLVGFDSRQRLKPILAQDYTIADDGLTYTFNLRPKVTFHNGDVLTSKDIVATWQTIMNPDLPVWSRLGWDKITAIDTPSELTAVIHTATPFAPFLGSIAAGQGTNFAIGPSSLLAGSADKIRAQFELKPVGTGPFRIKSVRKTQVLLEQYAKHWAGSPRLDRVTVRVFDSYEEQLTSLQSGEIVIAARTGSPANQQLPAVLAVPTATVLQYPGLTWGHLDLKNIGPLADVRVRQALDYATPRADIIKGVLGGAGEAGFADQAPGSWAFSERITGRSLDLARAEEFLGNAGYKRRSSGQLSRNGEALVIDLWGEKGDDQAEAILTAVADSWSVIGVSSRINLAPAAELWGPTGYQFNDRPTAGFYRWANVNDPDDMFYWHSSQIPTYPGGTGGNVPAFFNQYSFQSQIDDLTSRAAAETDPVLRKNIYLQVQQLLYEQVPVIFLFWDYGYSAAANTIGNFLPSAYTNLMWNAREWYQTKPT